MTGALWAAPRPLPAGVRWSPRSRTVAYRAGGGVRRLPAPVLAAETAVWHGLDGRARFGVHRAGVLDLYAAAVRQLGAADPYFASRAPKWQRTAMESCWQTAVALFDHGQVIQDCIDSLDLAWSASPAESAAGRRAGSVGLWATVTAAWALGDGGQRP